MVELTITVPETLAKDLRALDIAVEAVCQRALLDSVTARRLPAPPRVASDLPQLTYRTQAVVAYARQLTATPTSTEVVRGLAAEGDFAREVLRVLGVDIGDLADEIATEARTTLHDPESLDDVVARAIASAHNLGHRHVGSEHLLLSIARASPEEPAPRALRDHGVSPATLEDAVIFMLAGFTYARGSGGLARG